MKKSIFFFIAIAMCLLSCLESFGQSTGPTDPPPGAQHIHIRVKIDRAPSLEDCTNASVDILGNLFTFVPIDFTVDDLMIRSAEFLDGIAECFQHLYFVVYEVQPSGTREILGSTPLPDPQTALNGSYALPNPIEGEDCVLQVYPMDLPIVRSSACLIGTDIGNLADLEINVSYIDTNGDFQLYLGPESNVANCNIRFESNCAGDDEAHSLLISDYQFCCPEYVTHDPTHQGGGSGVSPIGPRENNEENLSSSYSSPFTIAVSNNPFQSRLQLNVQGAMNGATLISIYDLSGQLHWSNRYYFTAEKLSLAVDLADLSKGMYILTAENGETRVTSKVVKH